MRALTKNLHSPSRSGFAPTRNSYRFQTLQAKFQIAPQTNPLSAIRGRKVLLLADVENLNCSAKQLGYSLLFCRLTELLRANGVSLSPHAFFSRQPRGDARIGYFQRLGWTVHTREIQTVRTHRGTERLTNCDNLLLFQSGVLISRSDASLVAVASGDGELVCSLIEGLKNLPKPREVVTVSLAGSTSWRLDAVRNSDIRANIEIGLDCLTKSIVI